MSALLASLLLAGSDPRLDSFERLVAVDDWKQASLIVDAMALERSADTLRPDPLLSGLEGRMLLPRAPANVALAFLVQADSDSVPAPQRILALLALADAREKVGDHKGATEAYRRLGKLKLDDATRRRVAIGAARVGLTNSPAASLAAAEALAPVLPAAERWQADLIAAEASLLTGDRVRAAAAANRAWAEAVDAPAVSLAPIRAALVKAAIADLAGDREKLVAAIAAAGGGGRAIDPALADALPLCGTNGLRPDDWVTFAAYGSVRHGEWLAPLAASRIEAVALFADAIGGRALFADRGATAAAGGLLITARCRTTPSAQYHPPPRDPDPWAMWFASRGLLFPLSDGELADINRLSGDIETLARARPDDPRLIPLRLALSGFLRARAAVAADVEQWQVVQLDGQVKAGLRKVGGLGGFLFDLQDLAAQIPQQSISRATALARIRAAFADYLAHAPVDMAYEATFNLLGDDDDGLPVEIRREWLEALARRFPDRGGDPRRLALMLMLVQAAKDAPPAERRRIRLASGLPDDACAVADRVPEVRDYHIAPSDYPRDVLVPGLNGLTVAEFAVTAAGRPEAARIIMSGPSTLFDDAARAAIARVELSAPDSGGKPRACRGFVQPLIWKLPDGATPGVPQFAEPEARS